MSIMIVEDSETQRNLLHDLLEKGGFDDLIMAESTRKAFDYLYSSMYWQHTEVDLILMDILMPEMSGIEACRLMMADENLCDIPVIMVAGMEDLRNLRLAFAAGAMDFIVKPVKKIELYARVQSLLKLKHEMDKRKERESELMRVTRKLQVANRELKRLANLDGLTRVANRRMFDAYLGHEWKRLLKSRSPISLIMCDVDYFKKFNDEYGHQAGDDCLRSVAAAVNRCFKDPSHLVARYGGEEFSVILPETDMQTAIQLAETVRERVRGLKILHATSGVDPYVTISQGVSEMIPERGLEPIMLVSAADKALYTAKEKGRNQIDCRIFDETAMDCFEGKNL